MTTPQPSFYPICPHLTRTLCTLHSSPSQTPCPSIHYHKLLLPHTDERLGDCSYLNACYRRGSCRYLHWGLDTPLVAEGGGPSKEGDDVAVNLVKEPGAEGVNGTAEGNNHNVKSKQEIQTQLTTAQWKTCDLRTFDLKSLGKFEVVVADPPWAIHQELPYGTLTDLEMLQLQIGSMQDAGGLLFLWVTGRAQELGRECLDAWGYERIDEIVWIKTNQLGGLVRTGRTGHWLNHSKEHCLVAVRRSDASLQGSNGDGEQEEEEAKIKYDNSKGLIDTQVIIAEVGETSRKPVELYSMIERILARQIFPLDANSDHTKNKSDSGRKRMVELFGRDHNRRDGWLTLGNQFSEPDRLFEL